MIQAAVWVLEIGGYDETYSMDLRDRAIARVLAGQSVRSVSSALSISAATVVRWSQRYQASGTAAPGKIGGHKVGILSNAHRDWLIKRTKTDFTLRGLVVKLAARNVKVDYVQGARSRSGALFMLKV